MSINKPFMTVVGNLTTDPELRFTPNGVAVAKFRVLQTPRVKSGDEWKDGDPFGVNVTVWREMAENVAETLKRGMRVVVCGEVTQRAYDDKEGNKRTSFDMDADAVGPDLRWATATVTRAAKGGNGGGSQSGGDDAWGSASKERPAERSAPNQSPNPPSDGW